MQYAARGAQQDGEKAPAGAVRWVRRARCDRRGAISLTWSPTRASVPGQTTTGDDRDGGCSQLAAAVRHGRLDGAAVLLP